MAHFERPQYSRASVQTIHLAVGQETDLWVWGCGSDLVTQSTQPNVVRIVKEDNLPGNYRKLRVKAVAPNPAGQGALPQIQVVFEGSKVWDYVSVSSSATSGKPPGWDADHNYKHPGNVKVLLSVFWTKTVTSDPLAHYIEVASLCLRKHGLTLEVEPGRLRTPAHTIPFTKRIQDVSDADEAREMVDKTGIATQGRLVCIVCPFLQHQNDGSYGAHFANRRNWPSYIAINSDAHSPAAITLLHEMGHAAGEHHMTGGATDIVQNFMNDPTVGKPPGTDMLKKQVLSLAKSFFKRG